MNEIEKLISDNTKTYQQLIEVLTLDSAGRASERKTVETYENVEVLQNNDARNVVTVNGRIGSANNGFQRADFVLPFTPKKIRILASFYGSGSAQISFMPIFAAFSKDGFNYSKEIYLPKTYFGKVLENSTVSPTAGETGVCFDYAQDTKTPFVRLWVPAAATNLTGSTVFSSFSGLAGRDPSFPFGGTSSGFPINRSFVNVIGYE